MKDTIYREDAINCLCNGKCLDEMRWCDDGYCPPVTRIKQLPSAQSEVVRCKDCKHRPTATEADKNIYTGFSVEFPDGICPCQCEDGWYNWYPEDDFYCGKAERRGEL